MQRARRLAEGAHMRGLFGLVGLLLALAVVGMLVKTQLSGTRPAVTGLPTPASAPLPEATVQGQSQQIQQQYRQAVESAVQPARAEPEESR